MSQFAVIVDIADIGEGKPMILTELQGFSPDALKLVQLWRRNRGENELQVDEHQSCKMCPASW